MKKILIIEDEKEIRNILRVYLNACGYEVEEAEDGEEYIKTVRNIGYKFEID